MHEEVFLYLIVVPGILLMVGSIFWLRDIEELYQYKRFRVSSFILVGFATVIALGFINMSDSYPVLVAWLVSSCGLAGWMWFRLGDAGAFLRGCWMVLAFCPVSGWALWWFRFPFLSGVDATAERMGLEGDREPWI